MQAYVYKSQRKSDTFVYLAKRDDFECIPESLREPLGELGFVLEVALTPERKLARENTEPCARTWHARLPPAVPAQDLRPGCRRRTAQWLGLPGWVGMRPGLPCCWGGAGGADGMGGGRRQWRVAGAAGAGAAVSWWRGTRLRASGVAGRTEALALLALWAIGFGVAAVLVAWPLAALRASGSLPAALGLSAVVGVLLIGLWRTWPLWQGLEREGGTLAAHWRGLPDRDIHAWHGLGVAALVALAIGLGGALAWPGVVPARWQVGLAVAYALLLPPLHCCCSAVRRRARCRWW